MHFNLVIPICLLVISFAFFHEVLCEEEKIVTSHRLARLSKRGKFSKRCGPTNTSNSGCQPFTNVADPINGAANGINTATKSLPLQGIPAVPASNGFVPAFQPAPVNSNTLGLDAVTGSVLSTFPNLGGAPTYPTAQQLVAQPVAQVQPVAQAPVAQTPRPVAQAPQPAQALLPVAQAPVYGSSSIYPGNTATSTSAASSKEDKKKGEDDDDDDDDDDDKKKSSSDNEDDDDSNNEDDDDEE